MQSDLDMTKEVFADKFLAGKIIKNYSKQPCQAVLNVYGAIIGYINKNDRIVIILAFFSMGFLLGTAGIAVESSVMDTMAWAGARV
ncbi:hypothetical protein QS257_09935 [Terrilactibacillus sp. S3-3]|nr:hypothetical protein QS257_09935 [Terrilactibacillus sp. S3-3]